MHAGFPVPDIFPLKAHGITTYHPRNHVPREALDEQLALLAKQAAVDAGAGAKGRGRAGAEGGGQGAWGGADEAKGTVWRRAGRAVLVARAVGDEGAMFLMFLWFIFGR